jgi:ABC-type transport system involved in multi-copper enzyme maturation permease subunit
METEQSVALPTAPPELPTGNALWPRQLSAVIKIELRKNFWGLRSVLIYLLALLPVAVMVLTVIGFVYAAQAGRRAVLHEDFPTGMQVFANIFEALILRTVVFFGCAWAFMNLIRGEVVDRSLHYYFLSPVRREILLVGKYLAGLIAAVLIFSLSTLISLLLLYLAGYPESMQYLNGPGLSQVGTYVGITALACMGYGAFFLLIGLFFRNPIVPALLLFGWEWINFLLPPLLKKISVVHYLRSLEPVKLSEGPFAVLVDPTPAYLSIPGLFLVTLIVLAVAAWRIRRFEISYGSE